MTTRIQDGSAGDVDHGAIGSGHSSYRRPDERIARFIAEALGESRTVLNIGAGAGSYESAAHTVTAVEPSVSMRAQRPSQLARAIDALAEHLPFADGEFDAAMTLFSVHQWSDVRAGLREMRRVTRGPVVILTCDPALVRDFWLHRYAPEVIDTEARRYPAVEQLAAALGATGTVHTVPIPLDCTDGFNEAYYGRPETLLDPAARQACSAWSFVDDRVRDHFDKTLRADLESGALGLVEAQRMAEALFAETTARGLLAPGLVNARRATGSGTWRGPCPPRPPACPAGSSAPARTPCFRTGRNCRTGSSARTTSSSPTSGPSSRHRRRSSPRPWSSVQATAGPGVTTGRHAHRPPDGRP
nr:methyltransferase domain-containing protein [Streptomyces sp. NBC_00998]